LLATQIRDSLPTPPEALCPCIHKVIPIGVSAWDALQAMEIAIPKDLKNPYAITVMSPAIDDRCGSIAISQPMEYTVVHVHCAISPGILVDVCRELRTGHKAVVCEMHRMSGTLSAVYSRNENTHERLSETNERLSETNAQLTIIQNQMATLVAQLGKSTAVMDFPENIHNGGLIKCAKNGCKRIVTKRF
jgi:hypothetical protein